MYEHFLINYYSKQCLNEATQVGKKNIYLYQSDLSILKIMQKVFTLAVIEERATIRYTVWKIPRIQFLQMLLCVRSGCICLLIFNQWIVRGPSTNRVNYKCARESQSSAFSCLFDYLCPLSSSKSDTRNIILPETCQNTCVKKPGLSLLGCFHSVVEFLGYLVAQLMSSAI